MAVIQPSCAWSAKTDGMPGRRQEHLSKAVKAKRSQLRSDQNRRSYQRRKKLALESSSYDTRHPSRAKAEAARLAISSSSSSSDSESLPEVVLPDEAAPCDEEIEVTHHHPRIMPKYEYVLFKCKLCCISCHINV